MSRSIRYLAALLVAGLSTILLSLTETTPDILVGIFVIYALTTEIVTRYPELVRSPDTAGLPSGVFGGGVTFGGMALIEGCGFGAGVLGVGIAMFGVSTGYWLADSSDPDPTTN